ncbi:MAG: hypothetical protein N3F03_01825 [Ignavibacteria bacterium]|nr:hypothetical protein [Ignavibacteria bacterium]
MKRSILFWILAVVVTLLSAYYQRVTGPTYPISGKISLANKEIKYKLERSHSSNSNFKVEINVGDADISGNVYWKRFKTDDAWSVVKMEKVEDRLVAEIPPQPPAGKIEYRVELFYNGSSVLIPEEEGVVLRFKDDVPAWFLIPHIILIFLAMVFSTRAGLEYFNPEQNFKKYVNWTLVFLILGGFVFGPIVQFYAFGEWWTGFPFGYDLTDNKTLIALVFWLIAFFKMKKGQNFDKWILVAAIVMFVVFLIPHSLLGSELDYSKMKK